MFIVRFNLYYNTVMRIWSWVISFYGKMYSLSLQLLVTTHDIMDFYWTFTLRLLAYSTTTSTNSCLCCSYSCCHPFPLLQQDVLCKNIEQQAFAA